MNTPAPCCVCKHLYVDCMREDDPYYLAECWKGHSVIVAAEDGCKDYVDYLDEVEEKGEQ